MKLFGERTLSSFLSKKSQAMQQEVVREEKNRLLNSNETEYVAFLVESFRVEPLVLHWDRMFVSDREQLLTDASSRPGTKHIVEYHVPYTGEAELLGCMPTTFASRPLEVRLEADCLSFDVVNQHGHAPAVKHMGEQAIDMIRHQADNVARDVNAYNGTLEERAREVFCRRKQELLQQGNLLQSLGVPVRKAAQVPQTFVVPLVKKRVRVKPQAPSAAYQPEPALDEPIYQEILRITHELGIEAERHPSLYADKDEEALRDLCLMTLAPHFESATGETFNKGGKTDILIRHEKKNVFAAECTFWKGMKAFSEKIDQALGYLTWRDSKAAILCFVRNKELAPVLEEIEQRTPEHSYCVKYHGKKKDSWFTFEFHLPEDRTRAVHLAVQCFHFPPEQSGSPC